MIHAIAAGIAYSFDVFVEDFVEYFECSKSEVGGLGSLMLGVTWAQVILTCVFSLLVFRLLDNIYYSFSLYYTVQAYFPISPYVGTSYLNTTGILVARQGSQAYC